MPLLSLIRQRLHVAGVIAARSLQVAPSGELEIMAMVSTLVSRVLFTGRRVSVLMNSVSPST